jgi:hypothetical protein
MTAWLQNARSLDQEANDLVAPEMLEALTEEHQITAPAFNGGHVCSRVSDPDHIWRKAFGTDRIEFDADVLLHMAIALLDPIEVPIAQHPALSISDIVWWGLRHSP